MILSSARRTPVTTLGIRVQRVLSPLRDEAADTLRLTVSIAIHSVAIRDSVTFRQGQPSRSSRAVRKWLGSISGMGAYEWSFETDRH